LSQSIKNRHGYIAIIGRPNVGKSTLLNRLVGQKLAITSDKPQTTRHSLLGTKTRPEGQLVYVDTPGIHQRRNDAMNRYLNRTARGASLEVDAVLFVVEALRWTEEDEIALATLEGRQTPVILVVNKVDRVNPKERLLPFLQEMADRYAFHEVIPLSALRQKGMDNLERRLLELLPEGENLFPEDQLSDRSERFFAAELLREQLTRRYGQEIPYALTVEIERFEEEGNLYRIAAVVWVERPGQKKILIGERGGALKDVATQARLEMERFFDRKVFLHVWVKVRESWSDDENALVRLGYGG
jgi:GTPase